MKKPAISSVRKYISSTSQWFQRTSERSLDQAYDAAMRIKKIEDKYFNGNKISSNAEHGKTVSTYLQGELQKHLRVIKLRLIQFKASHLIANTPQDDAPSSKVVTKVSPGENIAYSQEKTLDSGQYTLQVEVRDRSAVLLEKLKFVGEVLERYKYENSALSVVEKHSFNKKRLEKNEHEVESLSTSKDPSINKTGVLPRSIIRTANRFKQDLDPNSEQKIIDSFHISRIKTRISIKIILLLVVVPLLTQQLSKNFFVGPIVDRLRTPEPIEILSNSELKEKIFTELREFEETVRFEGLLGLLPNTSQEETEVKLKEKAAELTGEYEWESNEPIKNILSDALSLGAFTIIVATCRREIAVLKSFMDELAYGLSDSAKAFIIILCTDVFVGYHSPHGWEVIVEKSLSHFGFPENLDFINIFIATIPVVMDTMFKYWIFRYFNQISPSAVATYKNMNE